MQKLYMFDNGYGASVVQHRYSYGNESGLWELAVTRYEPSSEVLDFELCYDTPITEDFIGGLTHEGVQDILTKIESL
ncbi:MAG: hypothetical protein EBR82_66545 [Caulobacteraceae bacterium]|nr:hypothetical protein [Caulobacteraceae bacterium]